MSLWNNNNRSKNNNEIAHIIKNLQFLAGLLIHMLIETIFVILLGTISMKDAYVDCSTLADVVMSISATMNNYVIVTHEDA